MDKRQEPSETETILMALDQISQTIDVMTSVVGRLRNYMQQQEASAQLTKSRNCRPICSPTAYCTNTGATQAPVAVHAGAHHRSQFKAAFAPACYWRRHYSFTPQLHYKLTTDSTPVCL